MQGAGARQQQENKRDARMDPALDVLVVGSANVDLVVTAPRMPAPGETVVGTGFATYEGGKGANQAVAVARLGGRVALLGCVGDDPYGAGLRKALVSAGVDTTGLRTRSGVPTGVAVITVDAAGENSIVVVPGANATLTPEDVLDARDLLAGSAVVLVQLETSLEAVSETLRLSRELGKVTVLNPAPAQPVPEELLGLATFLTPNRSELETLSGKAVRDVSDAELAAAVLLEKGAQNVVTTLGEAGALYLGAGSRRHVQAFPVNPVDTTAAGDAFNAAFAVALARGVSLADALVFANAAGALATTVAGAQPSLPALEAVEKLVGRAILSS